MKKMKKKQVHILAFMVLIMVLIIVLFQLYNLNVIAQPIQKTAMFFGNLTRDGKLAPIGTEITALNSSGSLYTIEFGLAYKIGEYGTSENGPMKIYPGSDNEIVKFKINGFNATPDGIFCSILNCPSGQNLHLSCTNCNNPPTLINSSVDKNIGNTSTTFRFNVTYKDADNDAPIWVNLTIDNNLTYKMNGNYSNATQQNELKNSRSYWYQITNLRQGNHTYKFSAYDGFNTTETSLQQLQVINVIATLTNSKVSPNVGNNFDTYNFSVTYTDYDNDTPTFINVTIIAISDSTTVSYAMNESNSQDREFTDGKNYYYRTTLNPGQYSYYFITSDGYNETQTSSANAIVGRLSNTTRNFNANISTLVNFTSEANMTLEIISSQNVTNVSINVTLFAANPTNASFSVPGLGKYIKIDISSELNASLNSSILRVYYTQSEIDAQYINESSLKFYWYNESIPEWIPLNETWDWVFSTGVDTTDTGIYSGNVWANVSHFSYYAIGGEIISIISYTINLQEGWNMISIPLGVVV